MKKLLLIPLIIICLMEVFACLSYASPGMMGGTYVAPATPTYTGFDDTFVGSNGSYPNTSNWTSLDTYGSFVGGSYFNIQSNVLQYYGEASSGSPIFQYRIKNSLTTAANRSVTMTINGTLPLISPSSALYFGIYNASSDSNVQAFGWYNGVWVQLDFFSSPQVTLYLGSGSGAITSPSPSVHTFTDNGNSIIKIWLVDSTHVSVSVNGTTLFDNIAITGSFGANILGNIEGQCGVTSYNTQSIKEFVWQ